jgi:DivIVA domain-containing protein
MGSFLLVLVVVGVAVALVVGVMALLRGDDPGLSAVEPDGRSVPLPATRPLRETDMIAIRFDTTLRGYRMEQVDRALRRAAYDVGYKDEMIAVLEAEVAALRAGQLDEAEALRAARETATGGAAANVEDWPDEDGVDDWSEDDGWAGEPPAARAQAESRTWFGEAEPGFGEAEPGFGEAEPGAHRAEAEPVAAPAPPNNAAVVDADPTGTPAPQPSEASS